MNKLIFILMTIYTSIALTGCADTQKSAYNSPEVQRAHADKNQGEMSSDIPKKQY